MKSVNESEDAGITMVSKIFHDLNGKITSDNDFSVSVQAPDSRKAHITEKLSKVKKTLPESMKFTDKSHFYPVKSYTYGEKCDGCDKELGKEIQYIAIEMSPLVHMCSECFENPNDKVKEAKNKICLWVHPNCEEGMKSVQWFDFKTILLEQDQMFNSIGCDGCGGGNPEVRYKCAACADFDFCQDCFKAENNKDHEGREEIQKSAGKHKLDTHPFLIQTRKMKLEKN